MEHHPDSFRTIHAGSDPRATRAFRWPHQVPVPLSLDSGPRAKRFQDSLRRRPALDGRTGGCHRHNAVLDRSAADRSARRPPLPPGHVVPVLGTAAAPSAVKISLLDDLSKGKWCGAGWVGAALVFPNQFLRLPAPVEGLREPSTRVRSIEKQLGK